MEAAWQKGTATEGPPHQLGKTGEAIRIRRKKETAQKWTCAKSRVLGNALRKLEIKKLGGSLFGLCFLSLRRDALKADLDPRGHVSIPAKYLINLARHSEQNRELLCY